MNVQEKNIAWVLPRPKQDHYKGGMPLYCEEWLLNLARDILKKDKIKILNLFYGMCQQGYRVDINPEVYPDLLCDAHKILITDSKKKKNRKWPNKTFEGYCNDVEIDRTTADTWLHKYFGIPIRRISRKIPKKLTQEEIQKEIDKMENYFKQIPEDLKAEAAIHFILEVIVWCGDNFMESMGLLTKAIFRFREAYMEITEENE